MPLARPTLRSTATARMIMRCTFLPHRITAKRGRPFATVFPIPPDRFTWFANIRATPICFLPALNLACGSLGTAARTGPLSKIIFLLFRWTISNCKRDKTIWCLQRTGGPFGFSTTSRHWKKWTQQFGKRPDIFSAACCECLAHPQPALERRAKSFRGQESTGRSCHQLLPEISAAVFGANAEFRGKERSNGRIAKTQNG